MITPKPIIFVPGTHSGHGMSRIGDWHHPLSPLTVEVLDMGWTPYVLPWDTELGGVFGERDLRGYRSAGIHARDIIIPPFHPGLAIPGGRTIFLTHSHGLQPALWAAAEGLKIEVLIDVCGPVRGQRGRQDGDRWLWGTDMMGVAEKARPNIGFWCHIYAGKKDRWQILGQLFDGVVGFKREHPLADQNVSAGAKADHSTVLEDPAYFRFVTDILGALE